MTLATARPTLTAPPMRAIEAPRYASVDALRGVVMFVMLFVNDVAGVRGIPGWMKHYYGKSGMTFVDWVFGGFLFIVGLSIPIAFAGRIARGQTKGRLLLHIATRTLGLLILGVLMVNEDPDPARTGWPAGLWSMLVFAFGILAYLAPFPGATPRAKWTGVALRALGFAGLAYLAFVFRDESGRWLRTQWWGILGLIGWAYLAASILYLILGRDRAWLAAATALLIGLFVFDHSDFFEKNPWAQSHLPWLCAAHDYVNFGECFGSHGAIALAGVVLGVTLLDSASDVRRKIRDAVAWGALLLVGALFIWPAFGISKNDATPAWALICAAVTCWLWAALAVPIDLAGIHRPLRSFIRGGQNVLLAYLLAPLWETFCDVAHVRPWHRMGDSPGLGITRALLLAAVVLWLAGYLKDRGVRLKL